EFDFLVTDLGDAGDGAVEVLLHEIADGVQLEPDAIDVMDGGGPGGVGGGGGDCGGGDRCFNEGSSVHGRVVCSLFCVAREYTKNKGRRLGKSAAPLGSDVRLEQEL